MISVKDFCKQYVSSKNKKNFVKTYISKNYIPYEEKIGICSEIVNRTMWDDDTKKLFKQNSPASLLLFRMQIVSRYTSIKINFKDGEYLNEYNCLASCGAIYLILDMIDKVDFAELCSVFDMVKKDEIENNRSFASYFDKKQRE